jgi:hypothetical protein
MLAKARDRSVNVGLDVISFTATDMFHGRRHDVTCLRRQ